MATVGRGCGMEVVQWLRENAILVTAFVNIGMLIIWTFYAMLFYHQYRRQRRPKILVHLTNRQAKKGECLIVNLTREPVHIEAVLIASGDDGQSLKMLTGFEDSTHGIRDGFSAQSVVKQGPMDPGATMLIGRISDLIERAMSEFLEQADPGDTCFMEVRVVAIGPVDRLFGARRRFNVEFTPDGYWVHPESLHTEQLTSRKANREVSQWLEEASKSFTRLVYLQQANR
jgi:hypothetical protein